MSQAPVQGERDRAMSYLHSKRKQFLDLADGLSEAQWNFKPGGEAWSLAELAEHLAVTERTVFLGLQASRQAARHARGESRHRRPRRTRSPRRAGPVTEGAGARKRSSCRKVSLGRRGRRRLQDPARRDDPLH